MIEKRNRDMASKDKISAKVIEWYKDNVMFHACWENWNTEDFFEAIKVIEKYEKKIDAPEYKKFDKFLKKIKK